MATSVTYRFKPLTKEENERAGNLPEPVEYRRTLKVRLLYDKEPPAHFLPEGLLADGGGERLRAYRIRLRQVREQAAWRAGWRSTTAGLKTSLAGAGTAGTKWRRTLLEDSARGKAQGNQGGTPKAAKPRLPGSNDLTIVTVRSSEGVFSFLVDDLKKGRSTFPPTASSSPGPTIRTALPAATLEARTYGSREARRRSPSRRTAGPARKYRLWT